MECVTVSLASATPAVAPSLRRAAHVRRGGSVVVRGKKAAFFKEFDEQYQKDNEVKEMDENVMKGWPGLASEYPRTRRESCRHATVPSMCRRRIDRPPSVGSRAPPRGPRDRPLEPYLFFPTARRRLPVVAETLTGPQTHPPRTHPRNRGHRRRHRHLQRAHEEDRPA